MASDLYYFSHMDMMVKIVLDGYFTHRKPSRKEKDKISDYITYKLRGVNNWIGVDENLSRELRKFKVKYNKRVAQNKRRKEEKIKKVVENLIKESMTNYYFEKIGDTILEIRKNPSKDILIKKLSELLSAYNLHTNSNISLKEII